MNLLDILIRREIKGLKLPIFPGLRQIHLNHILPFRLRHEVVLGFTADGRFLLSYLFEAKIFKLTFWLNPEYTDSDHWFDKPFAVYSKVFCDDRINDHNGVRFLQSMANPSEFVLIYAWVSY